MGWETRHGKRVYYRKQRYQDLEGRSRVRSVYCGSGERGERAAREDAVRRYLGLPAARGSEPGGPWWDRVATEAGGTR